VYTDDSDPVVAAMHAGFLKAAFGEQIDTSLLDLNKASQPVIEGGQENIPDEPMEPPPGMDLHITLLVVPALERYYSTGRFGVLSREWGKGDAPHDGVSFMVLNAKFVDEGPSSGKGRTGKERKARINALFRDGQEMERKLELMLKEREEKMTEKKKRDKEKEKKEKEKEKKKVANTRK
jgi:Histone deacetylation protein Rxt3